jgi:hypothetical protein
MFIYKSRFLTRAEVWFEEEPGNTRDVDWLFYAYRSSRVPRTKWRDCYTYRIDLTQSVDKLWGRLNTDTAYKIRRARDKEQISCEPLDTTDPAVLDEFERMYNGFAILKGLLPLDRNRIESMLQAGALDMSGAKNAKGEVLVFHANYRNQFRASQIFLPSLYRKCADSATRNAISRANRYLIWADILRYKEGGLRWFDFGGWYQGSNTEMIKINEFKRGFGGEVVREYKCEQVLTHKGRAVLAAANLLNRARTFLCTRKQSAEKNVYANAPGREVPASI